MSRLKALFCITLLTPIIATAQQYQLEWSYRVEGNASYGYAFSYGTYTASYDYDSDNFPDLMIYKYTGSTPEYIIVSGQSHEELFHVTDRTSITSGVNLDDEPTPEFITTGSNFLEVRSGVDGSIEWTRRSLNGLNQSVNFCDIDQDGRCEFIATTLVDSIVTVNIFGYPGRGNGIGREGVVVAAHDMNLSAGPNPFNGNTSITFNMQSAGSVRLSLVDPTGRTIAIRQDLNVKAGENLLPLSQLLPAYQALPGGAYLLRIEADGQGATTKVVKLP